MQMRHKYAIVIHTWPFDYDPNVLEAWIIYSHKTSRQILDSGDYAKALQIDETHPFFNVDIFTAHIINMFNAPATRSQVGRFLEVVDNIYNGRHSLFDSYMNTYYQQYIEDAD